MTVVDSCAFTLGQYEVVVPERELKLEKGDVFKLDFENMRIVVLRRTPEYVCPLECDVHSWENEPKSSYAIDDLRAQFRKRLTPPGGIHSWHVVPDEKSWVVTANHWANEPTGRFFGALNKNDVPDARDRAITYAIALAERDGVSAFVHYLDGSAPSRIYPEST
jgi:hypothetical protein